MLFKKDLKFNENNSKSLYKISIACRDSFRFNEAIENCKKAILCEPDDEELYLLLGSLYARVNRLDKARLTYSFHFKYQPIVFNTNKIKQNVIPTIERRNSSFVPHLPKWITFIPSYITKDDLNGKNLLFAHIPKTAGVNFANPIWACIESWQIKNLIRSWSAEFVLKEFKTFIGSYNTPNISYREALIESLVANNLNIEEPRFSFFRTHGVDHQDIYNSLKDFTGIKPLRVAIYRNPIDRIRSHFQNEWTDNHDFDQIYSQIEQHVQLLDNTIYRTCYDLLDNPNWRASITSTPCIDILIDSNNQHDLIDLQSYYLSSCGLPNILKINKLNVHNQADCIDGSAMDVLIKESIDRGFLEYDDNNLVTSLLENNQIPSSFTTCLQTKTLVHPVTFIYKLLDQKNYRWCGRFIKTEKLFESSVLDYIQKFYNQ